jgi:ribosomal protein S18 acetylase RimI-like enzyme
MRIHGCADLYLNQNFEQDYFFNKLTGIECDKLETVLKQAGSIFDKAGLDFCVHILDGHHNTVMENLLSENGFSYFDSISVMGHNFDFPLNPDANIKFEKISRALIGLWVDLFCSAFSVPAWKREVTSIINRNYSELDLIIACIERESRKVPVACMLLYNYSGLTGLYCLGTLGSYRRIGIGAELVKFGVCRAKSHHSGLIFVQVFAKDNIIDLYKKIGFRILYKKKIYVRQRNCTSK